MGDPKSTIFPTIMEVETIQWYESHLSAAYFPKIMPWGGHPKQSLPKNRCASIKSSECLSEGLRSEGSSSQQNGGIQSPERLIFQHVRVDVQHLPRLIIMFQM